MPCICAQSQGFKVSTAYQILRQEFSFTAKRQKCFFFFLLLFFFLSPPFFPHLFFFPFLPFFSFLHRHHPLETLSALCSCVEKRGEKEKKSKPIYNKANKKNQYFTEKGLRHPLIPISSLSFAAAVKKDLPASKLMLPEGFPSVFRFRELLVPANVLGCEIIIIQLFL